MSIGPSSKLRPILSRSKWALRFRHLLGQFRRVFSGSLAFVSSILTWQHRTLPFPSTLITRTLLPTQLVVVWSLPLQADSEVPSFISGKAPQVSVIRYSRSCTPHSIANHRPRCSRLDPS